MKQAASALPGVFRSLKWTKTYLGESCNYLNAHFQEVSISAVRLSDRFADGIKGVSKCKHWGLCTPRVGACTCTPAHPAGKDRWAFI